MTSARKLLFLKTAVILMPILLGSGSLAQQREHKIHGTFDGDTMYSVLPPDAIPAIHDPEFLSGDSAAKQMSLDEPVLGVVINGDARAYSLWQLDSHEIVNDVVGGKSIAATW